MSMKEQEQDLALQITMRVRCSIQSDILNRYIMTESVTGIRL